MVIFRSLTFYLAIAGIILAIFLIERQTHPEPEFVHIEPAINPYPKIIASSGIIEGLDKNIEIGIPQSGLVNEVYVNVWDKVEQGQPLFRIDDRELQAHLLVQKAQISISKVNVNRLKDQLDRLEAITDPRAISQEELKTRRFDVLVAQAQLEVDEAQVTQTILLIERLIVCAPQKGTILQNNICKGEFIVAGSPTIILANMDSFQVRADIDEQNAANIVPHARATAYPKNNPSLGIPLRFKHIEPYVIPKQSLTGASDERVDTRVLQVIYSFDKPHLFPIYVGQQVDVFIEQPEPKSLKEKSVDAL